MHLGIHRAEILERGPLFATHRVQVRATRNDPDRIAATEPGMAIGGQLHPVRLGDVAQGLARSERAGSSTVTERHGRRRGVAGDRSGRWLRARADDAGLEALLLPHELKPKGLSPHTHDVTIGQHARAVDLEIDPVHAVEVPNEHAGANHDHRRMAARQRTVVRRQRDVWCVAANDLRTL